LDAASSTVETVEDDVCTGARATNRLRVANRAAGTAIVVVRAQTGAARMLALLRLAQRAAVTAPVLAYFFPPVVDGMD
jgi:hypothetical protein